MADQSEPYDTPPVVPSIPRDHLEPPGRKIDRKLQHMDSTLRQLDLALAVGAQLMQRLGLTAIVLDSFAVEVGPRMSIAPESVPKKENDKRYYVQLTQGRLGS